jgi:hypothetical protein
MGGQALESPELERAALLVSHEQDDAETVKVVKAQLQKTLEFGVGPRVASSSNRNGRTSGFQGLYGIIFIIAQCDPGAQGVKNAATNA